VRADEAHCFASGYFGMPDKTVEAWRNQWVHTGDRVIRHADGTFSFVDRLKDVIRRRGENISSFEVEQVVAAFPEVEAVAVYPVPSDFAEDEVMAALVLKPGARLSAPDFFAACARDLPRHAVPRYVDFLSELPRTGNGKIQKFRLREAGVTAATVDRLSSSGPSGNAP
jgi:crotonobetaine/carnitine-CoA ligase